MRPPARAIAAAAAWLAALGCASPQPAVEVPAGGDLGREFFVRQTITASFGDEVRRFETALEARCGELRLVGLTPFGLRLFSAVRTADALDVRTLTRDPLPFPPQHVLRDVERTFFLSQPPEAGSSTRAHTRSGERIVERWEDGVLLERRIHPKTHPDSDPIVIGYAGSVGASEISEHVTLSNPAFGYDLRIRNYEVRELECESVSSSDTPHASGP